MRQEVTANLCLGTRAAVQEKVGDFFANLPLADRVTAGRNGVAEPCFRLGVAVN